MMDIEAHLRSPVDKGSRVSCWMTNDHVDVVYDNVSSLVPGHDRQSRISHLTSPLTAHGRVAEDFMTEDSIQPPLAAFT